MTASASKTRMTATEYLALEAANAEKHEFHDGDVFAMAGGSPRHNLLTNAVGAELRSALRHRGCHVLSSDQRVAALPGRSYVYPDVVVVCGELRLEEGTRDVLSNPTIVVEVLSPSTEAFDRGGKWDAYQRLESLTDYVLVSQGSPSLEHFAREADGSWRYRHVGLGEQLMLSNGATLDVAAIFDGAFELAEG